jgi:hypothetical protein
MKRSVYLVQLWLPPRQLTIPANLNATADYNANQVDLTRYNEDDADSIKTEIADYIAPLKLLLTGALVAVALETTRSGQVGTMRSITTRK